MVDFGCGRCNYIMNAGKAGFDVKGFDGNPYTPQITGGFAQSLDLIVEQDLKRKFDWVQSLEVGEHIPPNKTTIFVENLVRHAEKGMILSWGVIGQGGFAHINTKSNQEVIDIMRAYGFEYDHAAAMRFRSLPNVQWFQNSLMVFRKVTKSSSTAVNTNYALVKKALVEKYQCQ